MQSEGRIRLGTGAVILNDVDRVLLGLRGPNVKENVGKWELLGGEVQYGESLADALKRNVREEAGIEIEPLVIIGTNDKYEEAAAERWAGFTWLARLVSGEPHVVEEFKRDSGFRWVALDEALETDITPMTRLQLEQYREWLQQIKVLHE